MTLDSACGAPSPQPFSGEDHQFREHRRSDIALQVAWVSCAGLLPWSNRFITAVCLSSACSLYSRTILQRRWKLGEHLLGSFRYELIECFRSRFKLP